MSFVIFMPVYSWKISIAITLGRLVIILRKIFWKTGILLKYILAAESWGVWAEYFIIGRMSVL